MKKNIIFLGLYLVIAISVLSYMGNPKLSDKYSPMFKSSLTQSIDKLEGKYIERKPLLIKFNPIYSPKPDTHETWDYQTCQAYVTCDCWTCHDLPTCGYSETCLSAVTCGVANTCLEYNTCGVNNTCQAYHTCDYTPTSSCNNTCDNSPTSLCIESCREIDSTKLSMYRESQQMIFENPMDI